MHLFLYITTYGKEYYVDFDEYADCLSSIDTNIMIVENENEKNRYHAHLSPLCIWNCFGLLVIYKTIYRGGLL